MEEGGQRSTRSIAFIVPLELDCDDNEAIGQNDERDDNVVENREEVAATDATQSPIQSNIENGDEENESADPQLELEESSHPANYEGVSLQNCGIPHQSPQAPNPELAVIEASPADSPDHETIHDSAPTHPQRRAAQLNISFCKS